MCQDIVSNPNQINQRHSLPSVRSRQTFLLPLSDCPKKGLRDDPVDQTVFIDLGENPPIWFVIAQIVVFGISQQIFVFGLVAGQNNAVAFDDIKIVRIDSVMCGRIKASTFSRSS